MHANGLIGWYAGSDSKNFEIHAIHSPRISSMHNLTHSMIAIFVAPAIFKAVSYDLNILIELNNAIKTIAIIISNKKE